MTNSNDISQIHEQRTRWVVYLTAVTMVVEIAAGYWTQSMALLTDGFHMASHVFALGLSWIAYIVSRKFADSKNYSFSREKMLALSGFTSAIVLLVIAVVMAIQSVHRLVNPTSIKFNEAIVIAFIGLAVNAMSAYFLHFKHEHHDHNIRSAYMHVLADALTSVMAILALVAGMLFSLYALDSISGIISSVVITRWSVGLIRGAGKDLVEFRRKEE